MPSGNDQKHLGHEIFRGSVSERIGERERARASTSLVKSPHAELHLEWPKSKCGTY